MKKVNPITKESVKDWQLAVKDIKKLEKPIDKRIEYILRKFFEIMGDELIDWSYSSDADDTEISLQENYSKDCIIISATSKKDKDYEFVDKFGEDNNDIWEGGIPTRWLFEDFETEVIEGRKEWLEENEGEE